MDSDVPRFRTQREICPSCMSVTQLLELMQVSSGCAALYKKPATHATALRTPPSARGEQPTAQTARKSQRNTATASISLEGVIQRFCVQLQLKRGSHGGLVEKHCTQRREPKPFQRWSPSTLCGGIGACRDRHSKVRGLALPRAQFSGSHPGHALARPFRRVAPFTLLCGGPFFDAEIESFGCLRRRVRVTDSSIRRTVPKLEDSFAEGTFADTQA